MGGAAPRMHEGKKQGYGNHKTSARVGKKRDAEKQKAALEAAVSPNPAPVAVAGAPVPPDPGAVGGALLPVQPVQRNRYVYNQGGGTMHPWKHGCPLTHSPPPLHLFTSPRVIAVIERDDDAEQSPSKKRKSHK